MLNNKELIIAPSLLSADFTNMEEAVRIIEKAGGDWIHMDVMDGNFVPNITFGHKMVSDIKEKSVLPLDVHLMVVEPEKKVDQFIQAGADSLTFHIEAYAHTHKLLDYIKKENCQCGISIVPSTPAESLTEILHMVDQILIMTVNPGWGGQVLIDRCLEKVRYLDEMRKKMGYNYKIAVDGGVNRSTIDKVLTAGTDIIVTGSAFFAADNRTEEIRILRGK